MADADRLNAAEDAQVESDYHDALEAVLAASTLDEAKEHARDALRRWRRR